MQVLDEAEIMPEMRQALLPGDDEGEDKVEIEGDDFIDPFLAVVIFYNLGRLVKAEQKAGKKRPRQKPSTNVDLLQTLFFWLEARISTDLDVLSPQVV